MDKIPYGQIGANNAVLFLNGFHFVNGDMSHQMQANHHCAIVRDNFIQCVLYDSGFSPARLRGIEYIVDNETFQSFPGEEKQLWHSHSYEVTSGSLYEPGLPQVVDDAIMATLLTTYGKTFHTWRWDQRENSIPLGIPELVMGFTADSQLHPNETQRRDATFGVNSTAIRKHRQDVGIRPVAPIPGADSWRQGFCVQLALANTTCNITKGLPAGC
ncbi:putative lipo protein [Coniochaeta ligniaria NRRL 30616]|uniref:Putative lipo protein n=1 Tax=Coniochaeta ligniaria NRRL 30616 TaxID=1408157 RepID=A0A1J7IYI7_9PEZI|nr:putative lipo protein [Coniochaeta ligniaria NRRL 30616]